MFLLRGMPFIDLAHLRKRDMQDGRITYSRHKTDKPITVRIPREALALIAKYADRHSASPYLSPYSMRGYGTAGSRTAIIRMPFGISIASWGR